MTNQEWIDFLSKEFSVSRTSARDMLHAMMTIKRYDNFKRTFNPLPDKKRGELIIKERNCQKMKESSPQTEKYAVKGRQDIYMGVDLIDRNLIGDLVDANGNVHYEDIKNLSPYKPESKWVLCSDHLPDEPTNGMHDLEEYAEYNVMIEGASIPTTLYYMGDGEWWREGTFYKVERWSYLPEP